jgi:hypothetical protein
MSRVRATRGPHRFLSNNFQVLISDFSQTSGVMAPEVCTISLSFQSLVGNGFAARVRSLLTLGASI